MKIIDLLKQMHDNNASDLFMTIGKPPSTRIFGEIKTMESAPVEKQGFLEFFKEFLPPNFHDRLETERDLDVGVSLSTTERFRLNLFYQKGLISMVARRVPSGALSFSELRLPPVIQKLSESPRGLILITGATGSGKSTSMAAMLHYINAHFAKHIVTIEDPIEFIHQDIKCIITQREIGNDTLSFKASLKYVVRQSPDIIFIGELRDMETIQTAISAAMTGHLVVTTMHTVDVAQTIERIINNFPDYLREQIAMDFSMAIKGIISQRLLPPKSGEGGVIALEILLATPLIQRLISRRELSEIEDALKAGHNEGMQTFTRALVSLYQEGLISIEAGAVAATNKDEFLLAIQGMETGIDTLRNRESAEVNKKLNMKNLLKAAIKHKASDLLITVGSAPVLRIDGDLNELNLEPLTPIDTQKNPL